MCKIFVAQCYSMLLDAWKLLLTVHVQHRLLSTVEAEQAGLPRQYVAASASPANKCFVWADDHRLKPQSYPSALHEF